PLAPCVRGCSSRSCSKSSRSYHLGYPTAHYSAASSLPSFPVVFGLSLSSCITCSIMPRPTAMYFNTFNAFAGNFIGASNTTCTAWLILYINCLILCYLKVHFARTKFVLRELSSFRMNLVHEFL